MTGARPFKTRKGTLGIALKKDKNLTLLRDTLTFIDQLFPHTLASYMHFFAFLGEIRRAHSKIKTTCFYDLSKDFKTENR